MELIDKLPCVKENDESTKLSSHNELAIYKYFSGIYENKLQFLRNEIIFSLDEETNKKVKEIVSQILIHYTGFIHSPASIKYHGNYDGGLFDHSLAVYLAAIKNSVNYGISECNVNFIACMFHDLCKVGKYKVKKETVGDIINVSYEYNPDYVGIEHGAESLRRLLTFDTIKNIEDFLPEAWQLAIAYHMGVFGVSDTEMKNFSSLTEKYPEVLLLHHADMIATKIYKI